MSLPSGSLTSHYRIAVLLPCYNEEIAIGKVVDDFRAQLPDAEIYVYDNNSRDATVEVARAHGAIVRPAPLQGKGNVMRRMFADIEADIYVLADGDDTYDTSGVHTLIDLLVHQHLDIVIAARLANVKAFPRGHKFGNWLFNQLVGTLFGTGLRDIFSGYRVMSRRFVKTFPAHSAGFETETEMSIHILEQRISFIEHGLPYKDRPAGSESKLRTFRDGFRIALTILAICQHVRPLFFFNLMGAFLFLLMLVFGIPVISFFLEHHTVPRLPTAILSMGLGVLSFLCVACGLILNGVARTSREARHMRYLAFSRPYDPTHRTQ